MSSVIELVGLVAGVAFLFIVLILAVLSWRSRHRRPVDSDADAPLDPPLGWGDGGGDGQ